MPGDKSKLDYFIERTDTRLDGIEEKLDKLGRFAWAVVLLCMALSPVGSKVMDLVPKIMEAASAIAGGR